MNSYRKLIGTIDCSWQGLLLTNHVFAQAGFTLHGAPATLGIFAAIFSQI